MATKIWVNIAAMLIKTMRFFGIDMRSVSQQVSKVLLCIMSLKSYMSLPNLPEANELRRIIPFYWEWSGNMGFVMLIIAMLPVPLYRNHIDKFVQERRNSIAKSVELCLSCTNPSIYRYITPLVPLVISIVCIIFNSFLQLQQNHSWL